MSANVSVNLKIVKNILTLVQMVFINSIVYYLIVSMYRNIWVIIILFAVSAMKRVCFHYSQGLSQVSSSSPPLTMVAMVPSPKKIKESSLPIKKTGKMCAVCDVSCKSKCQSCKRVYYCCREHQLSDWRKHKKSCIVNVIN